MGEADRTLEQVYVPAEPEDEDVASAQPTCKMNALGAADATQEIAAADILESAPAKRPPSAPRIRKVGPSRVVRAQPAPPPVRLARPSFADAAAPAPIPVEVEVEDNGPASIGPIAIDVPGPAEPPRPSFESTVNIRALVLPPPRRLQALVIGVMSASLVILALATVRSYLATFEVEPPMPALASAPPKRAAPPPPPAPIQTAAPTTGTIMLAKGVRGVVVDGARMTSMSAVVPCGDHKVTAQGKTRSVDVPCGGTYIITP